MGQRLGFRGLASFVPEASSLKPHASPYGKYASEMTVVTSRTWLLTSS